MAKMVNFKLCVFHHNKKNWEMKSTGRNYLGPQLPLYKKGKIVYLLAFQDNIKVIRTILVPICEHL